MSGGPSLNHLVDEWKSAHITPPSMVSRPPTGGCFPENCVWLPNVSNVWPNAPVDVDEPWLNGRSRGIAAVWERELNNSTGSHPLFAESLVRT
jgi:hypothetical protein